MTMINHKEVNKLINSSYENVEDKRDDDVIYSI